MTLQSLMRLGSEVKTHAFPIHSEAAMPKRILCATDLSERAQRAIARAILLANQHDAQLVLLHVLDGTLNGMSAARDELRRQLASTGLWLQRDPVIQVRRGELADTIATVASETDAEIILLGARRRTPREPLIGSTAERVIASAGQPTLIVNLEPRTHYAAVVVAADSSDAFTRVMRTASSLRFLEAQTVHVVHGFESPDRGPLYADGFDARARMRNMGEWEKAARARLLLKFDAAGVESSRFRILFRHTRPLRAMQRLVRSVQPELLILGTQDRDPFQRVATSGASYDALRTLECDILVAPADIDTDTLELGQRGAQLGGSNGTPFAHSDVPHSRPLI
jgi:nucleotide-binding universal stress UspA family protein